MQGTQIGAIQIDGELGRGGMGVVYRGTDTSLGRAVAVKALPGELAADADRLARFEREARTLAQLNHPNVAGIHGVETHEGARYLVLEFVPGETLADRLDRGPIPPEEAVELALQIAAGVEAAHEAGVIHRDLKPQNVIITPEGQAKVLDFGLARSDEPAGSSSSMTQNPTLTSPANPSPTTPGVILGTAAYMSPEQARGRKVDRRTDVWSFGVVLYEMLTGLSPFVGETITDSIGAVLHKDPDLALLPSDTPPGVRRALARCLERDRNQRYRDLGDVAIELRDATPAADESSRSSGGPLLIALAALLLAAAGVTSAVLLSADRGPPTQPPLTFPVELLRDAEFSGQTVSRPFNLSSDGSTLVVAAEVQGEDGLWIRRLDRDGATFLSGTTGAAHPVFSPDGQWIAYFTTTGLWKVSSAGGSPQKLADGVGAGTSRGIAWVGNDRVVYAPTTTSPIMIVGANGGAPEELTDLADPISPRPFRSHRWPAISSDGRWVVFAGQLPGESFFESSIYAVNLESKRTVQLVQGGGAFPIVLADGTLVHLSEGTVYESAMDWSVPETIAPPKPVLYGIVNAALNGSAIIDISRNGTALYAQGDLIGVQSARLAWYDIPTGEITYAIEDPLVADAPSISHDGRFIALQTATASSGGDLLVYEHERGIMRRLPTGGGFSPVWAPDNQRIAYSASDNNVTSRIYTIDISGEQQPVALTEGGIREQFPNDWSRDGTRLIYMQWTDERSWDLNMLVWDDPEAEPRIETALATPSVEADARFSPDGAWIAYESSISGQGEVYIRRLEGDPQRAQISIDGGNLPMWGAEGRSVYFLTERDPPMGPGQVRIMRVDLTPTESGSLLPSAPVEVGPIDVAAAPGPYPTMDLQNDGARFIFTAPPNDSSNARSNQTFLMTGWSDRDR